MNFQEFKQYVIAACRQAGIEEYELYYQAGSSISVDTFQHEINEFSASEQGGVCFRCIVGGKMGYASTEDLSPQQAKAIVLKAADSALVLEAEEQVFLGEGGQEYEDLELTPYELPTTEELISTVLAAQEKIYAADPAVVDGCQTQGISQRSEMAIYNSKGLDLRYENNTAGLIVVGVVSDGKEMANDYQIKLGKLDTLDVDAMVKKAVDSAKIQLGGEPAPTGQYPVVFNPEAMSSLLNVFSSAFSSEAAQKGLSPYASSEGEMVASPIVTLVDDPFHKENPEPIHFDAEGSPTHKKNVIENGKLLTLLYNLKTAAVAGKKTTGNASKANYDSPVAIRPFTMYLQGGDVSEDELIQMAGEGVYITDLSGLHAGANEVSGDFSLQSSGFMIRGGKKAEYVKSFTVAGNFYEMLKNIRALADNCELPRAMGMTTFGAPSVLADGLSVAGK
ncbi:MAG: TldD/PmbA family protein [Oscillospiraceae bacterium]|nr:TldD/PmbA family protein [Oscillospiraceae bacterium]